ncbi:MAG: carboxymuconolactone decarboxylase family protein [Gemmatimonadota bacterium]
MSWIRSITYGEATGRLRKLYDRIGGPGSIDNILKVHGLRPHTLEGHMALYKSVLHHSGNRLPPWLLEAVAVYVSLLNRCDYCVEHHSAGLRRLLGDDRRTESILAALREREPERVLEGVELAALCYAEALTRDPGALRESDLEAMRAVGMDDGMILEVNQVASYLAYANRTVLGLGVTTRGDTLGLAPRRADDPEDWRHG